MKVRLENSIDTDSRIIDSENGHILSSSQVLDLNATQLRIIELESYVRVSKRNYETLLDRASHKGVLLENLHMQKCRIWDEEKKTLLENNFNLMNQIKILERDYNTLWSRFSNLQKSSRFIDSQIKLRTYTSETKVVDRYFTFEMASWPKEMEQKKQEIQVLRKQLQVLLNQSKFQQQELLLYRQEVDALFRAQSLAADENRRLVEAMTSAELSWADVERRCTEAVSHISETKWTIELLRGRLLEHFLARRCMTVQIRLIVRWRRLIRSKSQLLAVGLATRHLIQRSGKCPADAVLTSVFHAWSRMMPMRRVIGRAHHHRLRSQMNSITRESILEISRHSTTFLIFPIDPFFLSGTKLSSDLSIVNGTASYGFKDLSNMPATVMVKAAVKQC